MEEVNNKELVTKGLLLAFGTRCKEWFKINPIRIKSSVAGTWIHVVTSLNYQDINNTFNKLYIDVQGINTKENDNKLLNSHFTFTTDVNGYIDFGIGINLGTGIIDAVILTKNADNQIDIWLLIQQLGDIKDCLVDVSAYFTDKLLFKITKEEKCEIISSISILSNYEWITLDASTKPELKQPIGIIVNQLNEATNFSIVIDKSSGSETKIDYTPGIEFDKIYESTQTNKLNHGLKFLYDWTNPISKTDPAVDIINGQLIANETVKIPIPDILSTGKTGWATKTRFENGVAVELSSVDPISKASTTTLGGMYLNDDSTTSYGDKVWVQLDTRGAAFIDKSAFNLDKHRGDLNSSEFANPASFAGQIWQHIGETTESFVNGYFYKSVKFGYTYTTTETNTPYAIGTQIASKFEKYLIESGSTLNLDKPFKLYVDPIDFNTTKQIEDPEHPGQYITVNATFEDLKVFKIINVDTPTNILTLTKELLFTVLDTLMADSWKEQLTKDYTSTIMTLTPIIFSADEYKWRLWDVQPRSGSGSLFEYITNEEIDVLFEIHVEDIIISGNNHGAKGSSITLICEIKPIKTPHKEVTWTVNDSTKATVTPVTNNTAIVIIAAAAESGDEIEVICTSTYDPEISKTFKITVD